ncbi:MAG: VanZ family protein [Terriglobales bacterium]
MPVVAMCVVIFFLSQDSHSGQHSRDVLSWLLWVVGADTHYWAQVLNAPFRKFCHVLVYFVLSVLAYRAFSMGQLRYSVKAGWRALVLCILYAASDEYHQSFIPGRGPSVHDVIIDSCAAVLALILIWVWLWPRRPEYVAKALAREEAVRH